MHDPPRSPYALLFIHLQWNPLKKYILSSDTMSLSSSPSSDSSTNIDIAEQLLDSQSIGEVIFDMSE